MFDEKVSLRELHLGGKKGITSGIVVRQGSPHHRVQIFERNPRQFSPSSIICLGKTFANGLERREKNLSGLFDIRCWISTPTTLRVFRGCFPKLVADADVIDDQPVRL